MHFNNESILHHLNYSEVINIDTSDSHLEWAENKRLSGHVEGIIKFIPFVEDIGHVDKWDIYIVSRHKV